MAKSVFDDLFDPDEAADLESRAVLLMGIQEWLKESGLNQTDAAKQLQLSQARVSELKNGKISRFSLEKLMAIARRAGLRPRVEITTHAHVAA